jgi:hypothetical protein
MKPIRIFSALFIAAAFASCNQGGVDNTLNSGGGGMWTLPSVGTLFVYLDSVSSFSGELDSLQILATGQKVGGKSNVIEYLKRDGPFEGECFNIESNGDFSIGLSIDSASSDWLTFPTGSRQPIPLIQPVDTFENGTHVIRSNVNSFVGIENLMIAGLNLTTIHVREVSNDIVVDSAGLSHGLIDTAEVWFAPSLGTYVKIKFLKTTVDGSNQSETINQEALIKYSPK